MKYYVKIHKGSDGICVSICDENILGLEFVDGNLSFKVSEGFYKGDLVGVDEVFELFRKYVNFNLVGNEIINLCLKEKLISEFGVKQVGKVKHALAVL